jgi:anti-sigma factor RsiW
MSTRGGKPAGGGAHEEALLLPWYCNGKLARDERERVERHLAACAGCRSDLALWRGVAAEAGEELATPVPHPAQLQRLLERARAGEAVESTAASARPPADAARRERLPRRWRLVVLGQAAAVAVLVGWTAFGGRTPAPAPYRTLAAPVAERAAWRLRAVFAESTSERQLRELLVPLGARLVDGPSALGVYTLELPATLDPATTVAVLRTRPEIRFAEPVGDAPLARP